MRRVTVSQQRWLERWRPRAFLIAGGLLIASPATKAVAVFTDGSLPVWLVVLLVFPGLLVALAGTLGMYPQLADKRQARRLVGQLRIYPKCPGECHQQAGEHEQDDEPHWQ